MPYPQPPQVGAGNEYAVPTPVFAPQQTQPPLPQLNYTPPSPQQPVPGSPGQAGGAIGAVPIFTGGNVGPWGAGAGMGMFSGGLPSLAGAFRAARGLVSGSGAGMIGGLLGGLVGGPIGAIAGRYAGNQFFGGPAEAAAIPEPAFAMTPRSDLNALERAMREQQGRTGFGSYRGGAGNVVGLMGPGSLGIYEGSRMGDSRAPQTSAQNQMR